MEAILKPGERPAGPEAAPRRKPRLRKKPIFITGAVLLLAAGAAVALWQLFFTVEPPVVRTATTTFGALNATVEGTGTTAPADSVSYALADSSDILQVAVAAGDMVSAGDLLYLQDDSAVDEKITQLNKQIADYEESIDGYYEEITDSQLAVKDYQSSIADCYADIAQLQASMSDLTVTAPFSGLITQVYADQGDTVATSGKLALLIDDTRLTLRQYYSYTYEDAVYLGMPATVSVAEQQLTLSGTVTDISKVDYVTPTGTHCFAVTITVENPGSLTGGLAAASFLSGGERLYSVADGTLEYAQEKTLTAKQGGELLTVNAQAYGRVTQGATLFVVDSDSYETQIEAVQEQIERYEDQIQSAQKQMENNQKQITRAQSSIAELQEQIAQAEESRADYAVYSELDGQVISVGITEGMSRIMTGWNAVTVYNLETMSLSVDVDELDVGYITQGAEVTVVRSGAQEDEVYTGTVTSISLEATNSDSVATFPVTITIDSKGALPSGVNVAWSLSTGDTEDTVLAPVAAVQYTDDGSYLFVKADARPDTAVDLTDVTVPDGFYAVPVETGTSNARYTRILSGVEEGAEVFTGYQQSAPSGGDTTSEGKVSSDGAATLPGGNQMPSFGGEGQMPDFSGGNMPSFSGGGRGGAATGQ